MLIAFLGILLCLSEPVLAIHGTVVRGGGNRGTADEAAGLDPLVVASPIVAAAVCRDGIALLALHPSPILAGVNGNDSDVTSDDDDTKIKHPFRDLPTDFAGPFRLPSLDRQTVLLTAGWRVHAQFLIRQARALCQQENSLFGGGSVVAPSVLAEQCALMLATMATEVSKIWRNFRLQAKGIDELLF